MVTAKRLRNIIAVLADHDAGLRKAAAEALGRIGPQAAEAVPALTAAVRDREWAVREAAVVALGLIGSKARRAADALGKALRDEHLKVRVAGLWAIGRVRPPASDILPALLGGLEDAFAPNRAEAARLFGELGLGHDHVKEALSRRADDTTEDEEVREACGLAVRQLDRGPAAASR